MESQFDRTVKLIGEDKTNRLKGANILLFGVGGVGSYTFEALVRAGIGKLTIVDKDEVDITNINRQLIALYSTVGMEKVEVAKERALDINPDVEVRALKIFYPEEDGNIDFKDFDYVIDCVDNVTAKLKIIEKSKEAGVRVISSMGTGNKLDPKAFEVTDISKTSVCPLAKVMRKELNKRGIKDVKVLYSKEEPVGGQSGKRTPASISFVPSVAGLIIAGEVIRDILDIK